MVETLRTPLQIRFGPGGWLWVYDLKAGPFLVRLEPDADGRWRVVELHRTGRLADAPPVPLTRLEALVTDIDIAAELDRLADMPGIPLSVLASYFDTTWQDEIDHWVARAWRSQIAGSEEPAVEHASAPAVWPERPPVAPQPLRRPKPGRLSDAFLRDLAMHYNAAVGAGEHPAPFIADMTGAPLRTVRGWVASARARGFLGPGHQGKAGG
jgi:hypothetical protein